MCKQELYFCSRESERHFKKQICFLQVTLIIILLYYHTLNYFQLDTI